MTHLLRRCGAGPRLAAAVLGIGLGLTAPAVAQIPAARAPTTTPAPAPAPTAAVPPELAGRPVEQIRILGRNLTLSPDVESNIRNQIRTREGEKFDPATVSEDYQRVYGLGQFSNVEARVEPTSTGVIVIFEVTPQSQVKAIRVKGNRDIDTQTLLDSIDLKAGRAIDSFRLALAREAMERLYRSHNHPWAHVSIDQQELSKTGDLVFTVVEGPKVVVRRVQILGNHNFGDWKLRQQIETKSWFPLFVAGTFDPDQIDQDVGAIRQFYEQRGFFDARVGRKLSFSADQTEVMVTFVIDEGRRYVIDKVSFKGNSALSDAQLRQGLKEVSGQPYEQDAVKRDIRQIVRDYSPFGFIYVQQPIGMNPDYLRIEPKTVFHREAGKVDLVYEINEGKPFKLGRILIKGNQKTQDKVILREFRTSPGALYNSSAVQEAQDRIRALNYFSDVKLTPIGDDPEFRDLLVEVNETSTARFLIGAGLTSNAGVLGNISYEERNFDITAWPHSFSDWSNGRAFHGAGQLFRINLEPGTELTRASVDFVDPWIFDQPYSFGTSLFLWTRAREHYDESRAGGRVFIGRRFLPYWSGRLTLRAEDVLIDNIDNPADRAPEILEAEGHSTLTSIMLEAKRDTTDSPLLPSKGSVTRAAWESVGALGGDLSFQRFTIGWDLFQTLSEDLLDRKVILRYHADGGYIAGDAPFFERFYGGGLGSIRGFAYRGVSPLSGRDGDPVGGDFMLTGGLELSFPLAGDSLRGVVFTDAGTVERDFELGTIRSSVGAGIRWVLPFFGQVPVAFDLALPVSKDPEDTVSYFSFSLGFNP